MSNSVTRSAIHLLDLQADKGSKDGEEARKANQNLMADFVGSKTANQAQDRPEQWKRPQILRQQELLLECPQSQGHNLGGYQDRSKEGNAMEGLSPAGQECGNTTINGKD